MAKVRLALAVLIILAGGLSWGISRAQPAGEQYFKETGHYVRGEFLTAYYSTPYYEEIYGLPISTFFESSPNLWVQYFQKARFELHLNSDPGQRVVIADLGYQLYQPGLGTPFSDNSTNCRSFPQTGLEVCSAFKEYFESRGGVAQFGEPVSNTETLDGVIVQYFQKARFEYRPEFPAGKRVVLSDLGIIFFHYTRENRVYLKPDPGDPTIESTTHLKARAYPQVGVTRLQSDQTIHVVVQDQRLLPVRDALVTLKVRMPHAESAPAILPDVTNENGIATFDLSIATDSPGVVEIFVHVDKNDSLNTTTVTSFRTWW
jgi:hypothetical protein